jgi:hypothetical protein
MIFELILIYYGIPQNVFWLLMDVGYAILTNPAYMLAYIVASMAPTLYAFSKYKHLGED